MSAVKRSADKFFLCAWVGFQAAWEGEDHVMVGCSLWFICYSAYNIGKYWDAIR